MTTNTTTPTAASQLVAFCFEEHHDHRTSRTWARITTARNDGAGNCRKHVADVDSALGRRLVLALVARYRIPWEQQAGMFIGRLIFVGGIDRD